MICADLFIFLPGDICHLFFKEEIMGHTASNSLLRIANSIHAAGDVKLKILKEKLNDLPPADLSDMLEELDHEQRVVVINQLDADQTSDALEDGR